MIKQSISLLSLAAVLQSPVAAREWSTTNGWSQNERRVLVGLTIPFGQKGTSEGAPRVEMTMAQDRMAADGSRLSLRGGPTYQSKIGFTLDKKQAMMFNGREMRTKGDNKNLSTGAAIGIGAVVVLVGLLAIASTKTFDLDVDRR